MNIAVIFAGGVGARMCSREVPKQFLKIHGKPIIIHTIDVFQKHDCIDAIVVVCITDWLPYCKEILQQYGMTKVVAVVAGGATGQDSIYNGLCAAEKFSDNSETIVLIHDGVRPLINTEVITDNINAVKQHGSAITCACVKETVLEVNEDCLVKSIPQRSQLRVARAPQSFYLIDILQAHKIAIEKEQHNYVDSASMMKSQGKSLFVIDGPTENIKVTTPDDFFCLQAIVNSRENRQIYGI